MKDKIKLKLIEIARFTTTLLGMFVIIALILVLQNAKFKEVAEKDREIRQLKNRINELELTEQHIVNINGDSLKVYSRLNLSGKIHNKTHKENLIPGENNFYYVLSEGLSLEMKLTRR